MIGERVFERFGGRLSSDSSATPMGSQGTQCAGQCEEGGSEENKERSSSDLQCEESAVSQAYCAFCQKYRKVYPGAVKSLVSEIDDLLSSYQAKLSKKERQGLGAKDLQRAQMAFWRKIQTTNLI